MSAALCIGAIQLPTYSHHENDRVWERVVGDGSEWHGRLFVINNEASVTVVLAYCDFVNHRQVTASADADTPADALANARELGNFPDKLFEALEAPL